MAKGKYKSPKKQSEARQYRNSLGENNRGIAETYKNESVYLTGSNEFSSGYGAKLENVEKVAPKPISLVFEDWVKANWIQILITAILIPIFMWLIGSVLEIQKGTAVMEYRIERLEVDIDKLSDNVPNKENLRLELSNIVEEINEINDKELEERISDLEKDIKTNK